MRILYLLALLASFIPLSMADGLPDLGEASQAAFSPQQERRIGEAIMRDIYRDTHYLDDAEVSEYLNNLGYRLVSHSPDNQRDFEFFAIKDNTLNAFALPGGYIGVHTGLILAAQNESELAGVLAHEIAHVTQRHIARLIESQQQSTLPSLAALALAILASRSNPQLASAAITTVQAKSIQNQLDFTRDHEKEADRIGFQIMKQSGFDTNAMSNFFERLQKYNRVYENNAPEYLRTHPLTNDRIADMQNRAANIPYRQVPDSMDFQLIRAKLRAFQGRPEQAIAAFKEILNDKKYTYESSAHFGLANAYLRARNFTGANNELNILKKTNLNNAMIANFEAQLNIAEGQPETATELYKTAFKRYQGNRAIAYGYAESLLQGKHSKEALQLIKDQLRSFPGDAKLYDLQAQAYAAQGKNLLQHQSLAEAYFRRGNLTAAIEQLQIAQKTKDDDFYQASIIEARLKELRALDAESKKQ